MQESEIPNSRTVEISPPELGYHVVIELFVLEHPLNLKRVKYLGIEDILLLDEFKNCALVS
jgi:hypothetical protein